MANPKIPPSLVVVNRNLKVFRASDGSDWGPEYAILAEDLAEACEIAHSHNLELELGIPETGLTVLNPERAVREARKID